VTLDSTFKVKGHQAALLTAVLARQAAAVVGVRTCWPWETAATCRVLGGAARTREERGRGYTLTAARLQLVYEVKQAVWEAATICLTPCKLTFDLLTLKLVSELRATFATSVPILVFLGLSVLYIGPMYRQTDRQTDRQTSDAHHRIMPLP